MGKIPEMQRLNSMLLNNQWGTKEIKEEIKKYIETKENKYDIPKFMGQSKSSSKREVHSNTGLPQKIRRISNKQSNFTPKGNRKKKNK